MSTALDKARDSNKAPMAKGDMEIKEYMTKLELLYDVVQQASSAVEVSQLLEDILSVIQRILGASASSLFTIDEEKREFCLRAAIGKKSNELKQIKISLDTGIIGWVARNSVPVLANDAVRDDRFNKDIDEVIGFNTSSIIAAPLLRGKRVVGVLEMINKVDGSPFNEKDLGLLTEFASTEALILLVSMAATLINNLTMCQSVQDDYKSTVEILVTAADAKDPYSHGHSRRVKEYAMMAAECLNLSSEELKIIEFGSLLHDIGKIGIDGNILRKPGPLTAEELYIIRKHSLRGANIVSEIPNLEKAADIVLHHHEKYDGTGYPEGLKGDKITLGARLVAVADAFDTMTTEHAYRPAMNSDEAFEELLKGVGTQFCPIAVDMFISGFQKHKMMLNAEKPAITEAEQSFTESVEKVVEEAGKSASREIPVKKDVELAAKENTRKEAEEAKKAQAAELLAKEQAELAAKENARREAEEARAVRVTERLAKEQIELAARESARKEAEETREAKKAQAAELLAKKEAELAARERAKAEAEELRKEQAAEMLAKKEAELAAKENAKAEAEELRKAQAAEMLAKKEAELAARENARKEAEEARKTRLAEKLAKEKADLEAREKAKAEAEELRKAQAAEILLKKEAELAAKENARKEAEEAKKAQIAEKLAKQEAEKAAREQARKEAEEAKKAQIAEKLAKQEAEKAAREKAKKEAEEAKRAKHTEVPDNIHTDLCQGNIPIVVKSAASYEQINQFEKLLRTIDNLKIIVDSWSEDKGVTILVSVEKPMALGHILSEMPAIKSLYKEGKNIVVELNASVGS